MKQNYSAHRINKRGAGDNTIVYVVLIGLVVVLALGGLLQKNYGIFSITGNEQLSRTLLPVSVSVGQTFQVKYDVSGASGLWGVIIEDNATGCQFANGNQLKAVLLSDEGTSKIVSVTAPSSPGECTFSGNYQFGNKDTKSLGMQTVQVTAATTSVQTQTQNSNTASGTGDFFGQTLFSIGNFAVTGLIFVVIIGVLLLLLLARGRK